MINNQCPVCGNQGIPTYHNENVICPRCGSDLSVYKTLLDAEKLNKNTEKTKASYKWLAILIPIILLGVLSIPLSLLYSKQQTYKQAVSGAKNEIIQLRDTIAILSHQIQLKDAELNAKLDAPDYVEYTIMYNDSPWKIVKNFYGIRGDWKELAKKIAIDNQIWDDMNQGWKQIHPGQVIKVYNK